MRDSSRESWPAGVTRTSARKKNRVIRNVTTQNGALSALPEEEHPAIEEPVFELSGDENGEVEDHATGIF